MDLITEIDNAINPTKFLEFNYKVLSKIGEGGMGDVYKCRDIMTDEIVAIKILKNVFNLQEITVERFKYELELTKTLNHPHIVKVKETSVLSKDILSFVMEYIDGGSLINLILNKNLDTSFISILKILQQISLAIEYAHSKNIIHRDLKPENILLTSSGDVKVADFGFAKSLDLSRGFTASGETVGTPSYMSPEQLKGERLDIRTDIYSFGILTYHLITKKLPFVDENYVKVATMHLSKPVPKINELRTDVPRWFEDFIEICTEKKPQNRYESMSDITWILQREINKIERKENGLLSKLRNIF
ncbi:MAG: serine/threonine protein kinase [Proteobacteria bacterium]|nr:serine/threonine protein kinase [Pseudomonadota bacterium]